MVESPESRLQVQLEWTLQYTLSWLRLVEAKNALVIVVAVFTWVLGARSLPVSSHDDILPVACFWITNVLLVCAALAALISLLPKFALMLLKIKIGDTPRSETPNMVSHSDLHRLEPDELFHHLALDLPANWTPSPVVKGLADHIIIFARVASGKIAFFQLSVRFLILGVAMLFLTMVACA